ncbi:hypothetical protein AEA09_12655 [Lysinibacillus contaminans]|uniref:DUF2339 domain-containing protein n=1 Tax=Lysinibacillus contaminans TaxID=1293441 RepID=A0ABR5K395_9BACI|nr:DUF2339 domain-containing protein [Lysinibacillus contaminans]KOS69326.1 hypothetical protein AEA09_12655 [Lysinibacillus contaminans]
MSTEMEQRIAKLEQEVVDLRQEVDALKRHKQKEQSPKSFVSKPIIIGPPVEPKPKPVLESAIENVEEPKHTLEERIMWALPKVFMVILVLGVLWGLKLVSDYGYLSNGVKIILAYVLSVALTVTAYKVEIKKIGSQAITISLYGGAFIIGILTTAAGAILYEILGLYVALMIALLYIGYGIAISYFKKNEVLTTFVAFTSLLLPYLLEYMDFSPVIILGFIVVLFGALQPVIILHQQKIALYVATFFSVISISILSSVNSDNKTVFALSLLGILVMFFMSWCRMNIGEPKWKQLHAGLLFTLSSFSLLLLNLMVSNLEYSELLLLIMLGLFVGLAFYGHRHKMQEAFDVAGTLAIVTLLNILIVMNLPSDVERLLLPFSAFVGVMIAMRLRASVMKAINSFIFMITVILSYVIHEPTPFLSIDHVSLVLPLVYLVVIYLYLKRPKEELTSFETVMKELYVVDVLAVITSVYFLSYIAKIDTAYFASVNGIPHLMYIALAVLFAASLIVPEKYIGRVLSPVLGGLFLLTMLLLTLMPYNMEGIEWLNIVTRVVYIAVIVAILVDVYVNGTIAQKYKKLTEKYTDHVLSTGIVLVMITVWGLLYQLTYNQLLDGTLRIALTTITLFMTASISLWLSIIRSFRILRLTGFAILAFAIVKLVFIDLSSLDLFVRAVLFMTIGGLGLFLSNRLLKK